MAKEEEQYLEDPGYVPPPTQTEAADLLRTIYQRSDIEKLELIYRLSGIVQEYSVKNGKVIKRWVHKPEAQLMNEAGINRVIVLLDSAFSGDKAITNLSEDDVGNLAFTLGNEILRVLQLKAKEYDIKSEDWGIISKLILSKTLMALKASQKGGLLKTLKAIYEIRQQEVISSHQEQAIPKKKGMFGFLFGRR
jgi:predicted RecB family endonuclease